MSACTAPSSSNPPDSPTRTIVTVPADPAPEPKRTLDGPEPAFDNQTTHDPEIADDRQFGCGAFDPVMSQDACSQASDCAPSSHCHAKSCIAASRAPSPQPGMQCTMNLVCKSIDVGRCECLNGVCALVTR